MKKNIYEPDRPASRRLTYADAADRELYEQAAKNTGYAVQVQEAPEATWLDGNRIALWTYDQRADLQAFWDEFHRLKAIREAQS